MLFESLRCSRFSRMWEALTYPTKYQTKAMKNKTKTFLLK